MTVATTPARAVVAEDEPLLAEALVAELARAWPALAVEEVAGDGESALAAVLARRPDVVFLDIRMPGMSGLEVAEALGEEWPDGADGAAPPFPLLVFVTAYDRHALEAFDRAAVDYVLKPVLPERLALTCRRLEAALAQRRAAAATAGSAAGGDRAGAHGDAVAAAVERLAALLGTATPRAPAAEPLAVLQVGVGDAIVLVPVGDVVLFEAADKYVRVLTADREYLVRTALRELAPRLDPARFWQVHRGSIVRADAIAAAHRDAAGRVALTLRGRPERVAVSRLHAGRFKAM